MEIIWSKKELINIRKIILNRLNHKLDTNNNLIKTNVINGYEDSGIINNNLYTDLLVEFKELFYTKDRQDILVLLNNIKIPTFDKNNSLHLGLISCLSKININKITNEEDYSYIFEILKELASQYERVISSTAKNIILLNDNNEVQKIIKKITNTNVDTIYEINIKKTMATILNYTNLENFDIFKKVITRYDISVKNKLLHYLNIYLKKNIYNEEQEKLIKTLSHKKEFRYKYQRKHLDKIKEKHKKLYF